MEDTYQYHADLLASTLTAAARLRGGDGTADNNLHIDAVVQAPVNDARNNKAIARAAQRNAAPDDDPGNDDSDDEEDDDWEPGNNNPGNPGDNNDDLGDNNDVANDGDMFDGNDGPAAGVLRPRGGNDPGD